MIVVGAACDNCTFWERLQGDQGACRRFPPTVTVRASSWAMVATPGHDFDSTFPQTKVDDWCGEHRRRKGPTAEPTPPRPPMPKPNVRA